ncbi:protein phosphatase 1 regulatory subunit 32 isoform X1 [Oncorhynchus keta]|uniref:protein phosphatase 1 regulatory subunit 32 isoform X1 n=1 Tax=Oncorhynchus keta TaxID=8018 RepID=UPI00227A1877|nr:protein phosphatase 1 regulatory subunit 32 isoform X1 [Oncorhynchus keta]XP_052322949.1 protein phosphatase 1 regulatory subunit 32 isoform X1 [Oncorhynchus keta]
MVSQVDLVTRPSLRGTGNPGGRLANTSLNLYCTSYRASFGKEGFSPCLGHHYGTGYSANLRPAVYYSPSLDHTDNPQLGRSLLDSFQSQTKRHFQPLTRPDGSETLPCPSGQVRESGYLQLKTRPTANVSIQTEYKEHFVPYRPRPPVSQKHQLVGAQGESGFTEGTALQPNTFLPQYHMVNPRRTENSVMRHDFLPVSFLQGSEMLPRLVSRVPRETGFTRDTLDPLACLVSVLPGSGTQKISSPADQKLIGMKFGFQELSGFILNSPNLKTLSHTPSDPSRVRTHYQSKFCDVPALEKLREGWTRGSIHKHRTNGYTGRDTDRFNLRH